MNRLEYLSRFVPKFFRSYIVALIGCYCVQLRIGDFLFTLHRRLVVCTYRYSNSFHFRRGTVVLLLGELGCDSNGGSSTSVANLRYHLKCLRGGKYISIQKLKAWLSFFRQPGFYIKRGKINAWYIVKKDDIFWTLFRQLHLLFLRYGNFLQLLQSRLFVLSYIIRRMGHGDRTTSVGEAVFNF